MEREALKLPIVFVHGLGGFDELRLELFGPLRTRFEYFYCLSNPLLAAGVPKIYAAKLPRTASIEDRARALKQFVNEHVKGQRFHIIAHSMGGLDARYYIHHLEGARRVASLTTLGTPHHGSPIADIGTNYLIDPILDALHKTGMTKWRGYVESYFAGHKNLRPEIIAEFNRQTPDAETVAYFSYGGNPPAEAVHWVLRPVYEIMLRRDDAGPNDGLVPVVSAKWSGWRGEVRGDHISLINWQFFPPAKKHFKPVDFYVGLLQDLRQVESKLQF